MDTSAILSAYKARIRTIDKALSRKQLISQDHLLGVVLQE